MGAALVRRAYIRRVRRMHRVPRRANQWVGWWAMRRMRRLLVVALYRPLLHIWLRSFVVTGQEHIPPGPVIFAARHTSMADTPFLLMALGRRADRLVVTAARDYFFRRSRPGFGALVGVAFGAVPIDRTAFARRSLRDAQAWLDAGFSLVLYPHGKIPANDAEARRVRRGVALLARQSACPVVPVQFVGAADLLPPGVHWPRRAAVAVTFLPPLMPTADENNRAFTDRLTRFLI